MTVGDRIAAIPAEARETVLAALDDLSRPMTVREIDHALAGHLTRSQRKPVIRALAAVHVVAILPKA